MKIKLNAAWRVSPDGIAVVTPFPGETVDVQDEIGKALLDAKKAVRVDPGAEVGDGSTPQPENAPQARESILSKAKRKLGGK